MDVGGNLARLTYSRVETQKHEDQMSEKTGSTNSFKVSVLGLSVPKLTFHDACLVSPRAFRRTG